MYEIELTFEYQTVDAKDVLYTLDKLCPKIGLSVEDYSTADQVQKIESIGYLSLSGHLFKDIHGGSVANHKHDFLIINSEGVHISYLKELVELFIQELPVTQAFIHNREYYYWQNVEDTLLYDSAGKDHSQLPKTSNNLPFPLEQDVVDISNNPGRFVLKNGYRETVSSPMWLAKSLITDLAKLRDFANISELNNSDVVEINTPYETFDSFDGEQATLQNQLRRAAYGA